MSKNGFMKNSLLRPQLLIILAMIAVAGFVVAATPVYAATIYSTNFGTVDDDNFDGLNSVWDDGDNDSTDAALRDGDPDRSTQPAAHLRLRDGEDATVTVSTVGFRNIAISFWCAANDDNGSDDELHLQLSVGGGGFSEIGVWETNNSAAGAGNCESDQAYSQKTIALTPAQGAENNGSVAFRFIKDGDGDEEAYIDDLAITGDAFTTTANPAFPATCGLDVVLVLDRSGSIDSGELATMKTAMNGFVTAFLGAAPTSRFSVVSFATTSTINQAFTSNGATVIAAINAITSDGSTNWDDALVDALTQVNLAGSNEELVIIATDGNPNTIQDPGVSVPEGQAVASAVVRANAIKATGTRIIGIGIGSDLDAPNLAAITGPTLGSDYFTSGFSTLDDTLAALIADNCGGTLTLCKDVDGGPADEEDWTLHADGPDDNDIDGVSCVSDNVPAGTYNLSETGGPAGYQAGAWDCVVDDGEGDSPAEMADADSVVLHSGEDIECTITNTYIIVGVCIDGVIVQEAQGTPSTDDCDLIWVCDGGTEVLVTEYAANQHGLVEGGCTTPPPGNFPNPGGTVVPVQQVAAVQATPGPVVAAIQPPATGSGGLQDGGSSSLYLLVAGVIGLVAAGGLALGRSSHKA